MNLKTLLENLQVILGTTRAEIYAVVKANAYGHGMSIASFLQPHVGGFCVATPKEALQLTQSAVYKPVIVFAERAWLFLPRDYENIIYTVGSLDELKEFSLTRKGAKFYIKLNTGMNRLGCDLSDISEIMSYVRHNALKCQGVYTHFFDSGNITVVERQHNLLTSLSARDLCDNALHCCASNVLNLTSKYHHDIARVGLSLYGYGSDERLKPVMSVKAPVIKLHSLKCGDYVGYGGFSVNRDCRIAVVRGGYGDGYRRLKDKTRYVSIDGIKRPLLGQVCMDMFTVDIGDMDVKIGDEVSLLGDGIGAEELADEYETSVYEVLTSFNERVERVYKYE